MISHLTPYSGKHVHAYSIPYISKEVNDVLTKCVFLCQLLTLWTESVIIAQT